MEVLLLLVGMVEELEAEAVVIILVMVVLEVWEVQASIQVIFQELVVTVVLLELTEAMEVQEELVGQLQQLLLVMELMVEMVIPMEELGVQEVQEFMVLLLVAEVMGALEFTVLGV